MTTAAIAARPSYELPLQLSLHALCGYSLIHLFDDALADLFCLKSYAHGTSPRNYYQILCTRADPSFGGDPARGEGAFHRLVGTQRSGTEEWNSRGKFYVVRDDCCFIWKKALPLAYSSFATAGELAAGQEGNCFSGIAYNIAGFALNYFSPTLKFRFLPEEAEGVFENDPTPPEETSAFTRQPLTTDRIGIYGTFVQGMRGNLFDRIQKDPWRFAQGVMELIACVAIVIFAAIGATFSPLIAAECLSLLTLETVFATGRLAVPLLFGCSA